MKISLKNTILFTALLVITFTISSCYRKKDTIAKVTVIDANNVAVGGIEVQLTYGNSDSTRIDEVGSTNSSGVATFNFNELYKSGQAGFAVLDIYIGGVVVGIIKIEEETTSEETVTI